MRSKDLRKRLMVKFHGEEGLDYGGVARSVHHAQAHSWHITSATMHSQGSANWCLSVVL